MCIGLNRPEGGMTTCAEFGKGGLCSDKLNPKSGRHAWEGDVYIAQGNYYEQNAKTGHVIGPRKMKVGEWQCLNSLRYPI